MSNSLQDQLLKSGLVDKQKARTIQKEKKKGQKKLPKGAVAVDEARLALQRAAKEKAEKDRALNRQRNLLAEQKAVQAQIRQLIQTHRIIIQKPELAYQFTDGKHIKKLMVNTLLQKQLASGVVAVVRNDEGYALVPRMVAEKISTRDPSFVLVLNKNKAEEMEEDDPYANYQIPDDLMW